MRLALPGPEEGVLLPILTVSRALRRPFLATSAAAAIAAGLTACGSSSPGAGEASPATAVPAGAPIYVEATLRPAGDERANAESLLRKLLRTSDPGAKLTGLFDQAGGARKIDFARDVEPWLGQKAGVAMTRVSPRAAGTMGLAVLSSTDDGAAAGKLDALLGGGTTSAKHRDVEVRTARDGKTAAAVLKGDVLVGEPSEVRAGIDVLDGARESLAAASRFTRAREASGTGGLGFFYADVRSVVRSAAGQAGPAGALLGPVTDTLPDTVSATLHAQSDAFTVDGASIGGAAAQAATGSGAADALAAAPADSWLAAGVGDIGKSLGSTLDSVGGSGLGSIGVGQIEDQVRKASGLDLRRDLLSWMGNGAFFVEGNSAATLGGGLVVHSTDPGKTATAVRRLGPLVRRSGNARVSPLQAPGVSAGWSVRSAGGPEVLLAAAGDRFVVAVGRHALNDALQTTARLGDAAAFRDAATKLGDGYATSFWLNLPVVADLVERFAGGTTGAAGAAGAVATLRTFGPVTAGTKRDGDITRVKLRVAVP
jgi:hypothetical protein